MDKSPYITHEEAAILRSQNEGLRRTRTEAADTLRRIYDASMRLKAQLTGHQAYVVDQYAREVSVALAAIEAQKGNGDG